MSNLFIATINPIQGFIVSARRTRDLYCGSRLLDDLSLAAPRETINQGKQLICPAPGQVDWLQPHQQFSVASILLAPIQQEPESIVEHVYSAFIKGLCVIRDTVYQTTYLSETQLTKAPVQIYDLIEFIWDALLYGKPSYYMTPRLLKARIVARKKICALHPEIKRSNYVPKSSLDGQLESVISEYKYISPYKKKWTRRCQLYLRYSILEVGCPSRVDLLKRCEEIVFNTCSSPTLPFLEPLEESKRLAIIVDDNQFALEAGMVGLAAEYRIITLLDARAMPYYLFFPYLSGSVASFSSLLIFKEGYYLFMFLLDSRLHKVKVGVHTGTAFFLSTRMRCRDRYLDSCSRDMEQDCRNKLELAALGT